MRAPEWIQIGFSLALVVFAWVRPLELRRRMRIALLAGIVLAAICIARFALPLHISSVVRDWLQAALLLLPYWQAGQFFTKPNTRVEKWLARLDNRVLDALARRGWKIGKLGWETYFELAYLMCYPLVPIGLGVLYMARQSAQADFYWVVVVLASDLCFAATILVPAMPPRLLPDASANRISRNEVRKLNLEVLGRGSIRAVTFPSAHVASATACALVLLRFVPLAGAVFLLMAVSIALGAFLGRYHYLLDVLLGGLVALAVFGGCLWLR